MSTIQIVLIDEQAAVTSGLRLLLDKEPGLEVVAQATSSAEAVQLASEHKQGTVVIIGVDTQGKQACEIAAKILSQEEEAKVLVLSTRLDRSLVVEMLHNGATGFLLRECSFPELVRAVRALADGQTFLGRGVADLVIREYRALLGMEHDLNPAGLTSREREVLQLIAEGRTSKEIAARLGVTAKTLESHRKNIYDKLATQSVAKLTKYAIREGLTSLEG